MNNPNNLLYTKSHEWVEYLSETTARVGITDFAQKALGDLVFINLPEPGDPVNKETPFADVESVKAVSDIISPFTGDVEAVNEKLTDAPESMNSDPYGAWLVQITRITDKKDLLDAAAYEKYCSEEK
jgi:glycine cleavage system H protein